MKEEFIAKLHTLGETSSGEVVAQLYELVAVLEQLPEAEEVVPEIFAFMERFPELDIGVPGPLVHFVERFYPRYVEHLIASVERQPVLHTIWMSSRILNARLLDETRERLLAVLGRVPDHPAASKSVKTEAARLLARHERNGRHHRNLLHRSE